MQNSKKKGSAISSVSHLKNKSFDFISAGIGCNCLVALHEAGILEDLIKYGAISEKNIEAYGNSLCIKSAIITLEKCDIIERGPGNFKLTEFGMVLSEYIGLITIFFDGYGELVANQAQIVKHKKPNTKNLVKWPVVSKSSICISEKTVDPLIVNEFLNFKFSGTICDLGCGHGVMLSKICEKTGNPGLGFESSSKTVKQAKKQLAANNIAIEVADITHLQGIWEDVVCLMQAFVFHDFVPENRCIKILNSYLDNFPNLRYFFYVDIVTPSAYKNEIFPGFDYIHGLLGVPTRTYEETLEMFDHSNYTTVKEIPIPNLPNTFLWILSPKTRNFK